MNLDKKTRLGEVSPAAAGTPRAARLLKVFSAPPDFVPAQLAIFSIELTAVRYSLFCLGLEKIKSAFGWSFRLFQNVAGLNFSKANAGSSENLALSNESSIILARTLSMIRGSTLSITGIVFFKSEAGRFLTFA